MSTRDFNHNFTIRQIEATKPVVMTVEARVIASRKLGVRLVTETMEQSKAVRMLATLVLGQNFDTETRVLTAFSEGCHSRLVEVR